eukprot:gb/GFBE01008636.1/.p1 GENE.gb/GFBE01008636.1/~~gb/GFBE01008636.1/.p1  ORF type:complete len:207 (+),score=25.71 gb/GFBE01008636.1/:1-621(+)
MLQDKGTCKGGQGHAAQINYDHNDRSRFFMPGFSWFVEHPELDMEVLAVDLNYLWVNYTCPWTACEEECRARTWDRMTEGLALFHDRMAKSNASNLVVFSHYPTDYLWGLPTMLGNLSNGTRPEGLDRQVNYFAGHRHNVDQNSTTSIAPNGNSWLVGGGGGWGCDGEEQGFVVGELLSNGTLVTRSVLIDHCICCHCRSEDEIRP